MRRFLGSFALLALLAGGAAACGDDDGRSGDGPLPSAPSSSAVDATTVAIISVTAAGGTVDTRAVPLPDAAAVRDFGGQFRQPAMVRQLIDKVASTDVPDGQALVGAVVAIGCDVPPGVTITETDDGVVITADEVPSPMPECFAAVTSVALVLLDADLV
jgi:hypothetical protein